MKAMAQWMLVCFCVLAGVLFVSKSSAAAVSISASVDKNQASLDDYIVLKVTVEGTREEPTMPDLSAFKFQSRGSSSQISIINGSMSSRLEYNYILYPQKTGTFTIGSFQLDSNGKKVQSSPLTVTITKSDPQARQSDEVFVTASVDNESPYLNEQIVYSFQFCRRVKIANASLTEQPSFDGFLVESLGKEREYQKVINGQQYLVTEIRQALFPVKTGVFEITPSTLQAAVVTQKRSRRGADPFFDDSFFGFAETVPKTFRTNPITITIKPLPADGRPADFRNLVGDFTVASQLSKTKVQAGESLTLTLTISGAGNLKNLQTLDLGQLQNFKVYDDKPVFEPAQVNGKIGGKLVIKKALVPLVPGTLTVPPVSISFFDPVAGVYKTAAGPSYAVQVSPAAGKENIDLVQAGGQAAANKQEVQLLGKDILPVHTTHEALKFQPLYPAPWLMLLLVLAPAGVFFAVFFGKRARERSSGDPGGARLKSAYRNFTKNFAEAKKALDGPDDRFYQAGSKALKEFIGDRLNIAGQALTVRDLDGLLGTSVSAGILAELKNMMDFFDSGQFGFKTCSRQERKDVLNRLQEVILQLNRTLRK
jgi:hypothetical protein